MDLLELVEEADLAFQIQRPEFRNKSTFADYLPRLAAANAEGHPELRFPLLAALAKSDLELSLVEGNDVSALNYLQAVPELAASPAVINDLLLTEARFRCRGDVYLLWQFVRDLPLAYRELFQAERASSRYELLNSIGKGGEAEVWRAIDKELNREVAVKVPHRQEHASLQRFLREARLTARFEHPAIVPVYGLDRTSQGNLCYAMQRLELSELTSAIQKYHLGNGSPDEQKPALQQPTQSIAPTASPDVPSVAPATDAALLVSAPAPVRPAQAHRKLEPRRRDLSRMVGQLIIASRAVAYAHQQRYLHLDLKPANIVVGDFGETIVLDWGMAQSHQEAAQLVQGGTLPYLSPEVARQWLGEASATPSDRTDVYGLGATLYHILTGRAPFAFGTDLHSRTLASDAKNRVGLLTRLAHENPRPILTIKSRTDRVLAAICAKAMSVDPENRYASAVDFANDLEKWQSDEETVACPFSSTEKMFRWIARNVRSLIGVGVVLLILGFAAFFGERWLRYRAVEHAIDELPTESAAGMLPLITRIQAQPQWAKSLLQARLSGQNVANSVRPESAWRYRLALLRLDAEQVAPLLRDAMTVDQPEDFTLIAEQIRRHAPPDMPPAAREALSDVAKRLDAEQQSAAARIRAAAIVSGFDPSYHWDSATGRVIANDLVQASPTWLAAWVPMLTTPPECRRQIMPWLAKIAADSGRQSNEVVLASALLANWLADDPSALIKLLADATPQQLAPILEAIDQSKATILPELVRRHQIALTDWQKSAPPITTSDQQRQDQLAAAAANLSLAIWQLAPASFDSELLAHAADPRLRTELIHRFRAARFSGAWLIARAQAATEPAHRSALILALGAYRPQEISDEVRSQFVEELRATASSSFEPELASSTEWLCRQWNISLSEFKRSLVRRDQIGSLFTTGHKTARNSQLVTIPHSVAARGAVLGALPTEGHHDEDETPREIIIPRSFAVASTEVTRAQYREFLQQPELSRIDGRSIAQRMAAILDPKAERFQLTEEHPVFEVTFAQAAAYCNWLSERENLEPCYPDDALLLALVDLPEPFPELDDGLLNASGYRLPTEAEWELACRAGTTSPRSYGYREQYLSEYAVYRFNSRLGPLPIGYRRPNAWGLFDMLGNVSEWCHTSQAARSHGGKSITDAGPLVSLEDGPIHLRGGAHFNTPDVVRSAYRHPAVDWRTKHVDVGFRVARTFPAVPSD